MKKYVSLDKRSKKARREYYSQQRRTWGELNPVTKSVPDDKKYNRKKEKQRISHEFREESGLFFLAVFLMFFGKCTLAKIHCGTMIND